jgi:hypothetical protein
MAAAARVRIKGASGNGFAVRIYREKLRGCGRRLEKRKKGNAVVEIHLFHTHTHTHTHTHIHIYK